MHRHELSEVQWERIKDVLPSRKRRGRPPSDARQMLNGMMWIVRTGAPWRDLLEGFGPWQTVYKRFNRWSRTGVWDRVLGRLQSDADAQGKIDWELFCIDGSVVRASRAAAGARKKSGRAQSRKTTR
jgi:transposase